MRIKRGIVGGELGGPMGWQYGIAFLMIGLWILYIVLCFVNNRTDNGLEDSLIPASFGLVIVALVAFAVFEMLARNGTIKLYEEPGVTPLFSDQPDETEPEAE